MGGDSGFWIATARSFDRRHHNPSQFIRLKKEWSDQLRWLHAACGDQVDPKRAFVRLLLNNRQLGDELRTGTTSAGRAVIRSHGCPAAHELICDRST